MLNEYILHTSKSQIEKDHGVSYCCGGLLRHVGLEKKIVDVR